LKQVAIRFDEETPGIGEFHNPSLVTSEEMKSMQ